MAPRAAAVRLVDNAELQFVDPVSCLQFGQKRFGGGEHFGRDVEQANAAIGACNVVENLGFKLFGSVFSDAERNFKK